MINETNYTNNPLTKEQENKIDELLTKYDTTVKPGLSIGIIKDSKLIYKKSFGLANLEFNIPNKSDTKFELGSETKQFTATCIALLQIEGELSFDDDIRKHLSELPDYGKMITIKNLIFHTSGIMDYPDLMRVRGVNYEATEYSNIDILKLVSRINKLSFSPGEKYLYSNTGYLLLAEIIERVSGKCLPKFAKERIFDPLGMNDTQIIDDWQKVIKNRATSYAVNDEGVVSTYLRISNQFGGIGGISTINDLLLWDQNFYSGKVGGNELKEIRMNLQRQLETHANFSLGLGLYFWRYKNIHFVFHGGEWLYFCSQISRYPKQDTSVIVLANTDVDTLDLTNNIADIVLADVLKEPNAEPESNEDVIETVKLDFDLDIFIGNYCAVQDVNGKKMWNIHHDSGHMMTKKIFLKNGSLYLDESRLNPISDSKFVVEGMSTDTKVVFEVTKSEKVISVLLNEKITIAYKSYEIPNYSLDELQRFTGKFYSKILDVEYDIKVKNDKLNIFINDKKMSSLSVIMESIFNIDEWYSSMHFKLNDKNEVTGLILNSCRIHNIEFEKRS
jgi:CubicO group peptidase (beta-lactamase class C family)